MRKFLVTVVVLLILLVVADRVAVRVADSAVASSVQNSQNLRSRPHVDITGFPFLTQVARGKFDKIDVSAASVVVGGSTPITVTDVAATLSDVTTSRDLHRVTAGDATGSGTIGYASLSARLGVPLSYGGTTGDGHGRVRAAESITVLGQKFTGSVSAEVQVTGDNQLAFTNVQIAGVDIPQAVTSGLEQVFSSQLSLVGLPIGLTVQDVRAGGDGIRLTLTGHDVRLK